MNQRILMTALAAAALSACGGGGDDGSEPPPAATSIVISGTAATGAAIVGGQVDVKCAAGSGGTTTLADGTFTVTLSGAALPCVLRVTTGSAELYSLAENGSGSAVRANITPFSHLVAAKAVGGDLSAFYTSFDVSDQAKLDSTAVASAITAVTAALSGTASFAGVNPITGTFVIGDTFDQQLDAFQAALTAAGTTLEEVRTEIVVGGPVEPILRPVAATCGGLRSGKYRVINPHEAGHDPDYVAHVITVDATALTVTDDLDVTHTPIAITPDATTACQFTLPDEFGTATLLVSKSGLSVIRVPTADVQKTLVAIVVPEQVVPVSELAGTWNHLAYERSTSDASFTPDFGATTIDATGHITARTNCTDVDTCTAAPSSSLGTWVANVNGGFDDGSTKRSFAFKAAGGGISLFQIDKDNGSILVAAKQIETSLPVVDTVSKFWDFNIGSTGFASSLTDTTTTVTAVDTVAQSYTRTRSSDGRLDTFTINKPSNGLRYRPLGTSPVNGGGTVNLSETINMPLRGAGAGFFLGRSATQTFFGISIDQP